MDDSELIEPHEDPVQDEDVTEEVSEDLTEEVAEDMKEEVTEDVTEDISSRWSCEICDRHYGTNQSLKRHMKTHEEGIIFCSSCTQFFKTEEEKQNHMESKHPVNVCETCGKVFITPNSLKMHRLKHLPISEMDLKKCPFADCDKVFRQKSKMEDHMNSHTGAKPYSCTHCFKTFGCRYTKNEHVRMCSKGAEYRCNICNTVYNHRSSLRNHNIAAHSAKNFTCSCGAHFKYRTSLKRHKRDKNH